MSDLYDDYECKIQLAEHAWEIKEARRQGSSEVMRRSHTSKELNMTGNIKPFIKATTPDNSEAIEMLEQWLEDAKSGEIVTVAIVGKRVGGEWQTGMSSSQNRLEDAAMLIELGMRRLGFNPQR